jgi:hypothetical protein
MKKVIALSTVLVFGALGMACDGGAAPNANNGNTKMTNVSTPAPVNTATPVTTAPNTNGGTTNANVKPMTNANENKKP